MSLQHDGALIVSQRLLDQRAPDLYERFLQLVEKFQYRDPGRAVADALLCWVEAHEHSDTTRPPSVHDAGPDATLQESAVGAIRTPPPPAFDDEGGSGPSTNST
jgi:hypothetical protein